MRNEQNQSHGPEREKNEEFDQWLTCVVGTSVEERKQERVQTKRQREGGVWRASYDDEDDSS